MTGSSLADIYADEERRVILLIDSKSFYASVECVERNLNPLKALLVVMSHQENDTGGLVLASSPMAKKTLGISNVTRQRDVPDLPGLIKAQPRMNLYIQENLKINNIYRQYVDDDHLLPYSIDESILDITDFWHLFGKSPVEVARKIQHQVRKETGIYLSVGIGDSPVLAKMALDLDAKSRPDLLAVWHYEDVPEKLWPIDNFRKVWGIGSQTAAKLERWGIHSMGDLAQSDPYIIRDRLGLVGEQLYAQAWGIDRSQLDEIVKPKNKSYSNSQVLPRNYQSADEIRVVVKEMADQVASRIRAHHQTTSLVSLYLGYANRGTNFGNRHRGGRGLHQQVRIEPTNQSAELIKIMSAIFDRYWTGEAVRHVGVSYDDLHLEAAQQLDFFSKNEVREHQIQIDQTMDQIRQRFGTASLVRAMSLERGATAISRANLVGGHNGGNAYG
ncbi:Y-family DNA polymerase [Eupransor demetentiae]|uniref:Nucleotidyltransferase/DNA polymerase DinP involved in DNA repair (DinP) n=1 Tax=Eupransor demetentiae TaxID=3109584 RepID=A0ABP0EQ96_9LACO|nr:Nucleotidyltransferase/DNA polymerase DinP involved in DNA repair (DinP) [Lactobacillaceae bacterium LMG 33000]